MQKCTYVSESLKNGRLMRWTIMPLKVYIAPMKFYSKAGEDYKYRGLVRRALDEWQAATKGKISFRIVETLLDSNINIEWKRVDRKALGYCNFSFDASHRLYGAEVSIGLTEGKVHADYMDENEVYHTILHEIGHAVGLGHSPNKKDIMYTPHQRGVNKVSSGDVLTVNWLYRLPQGATVAEIASRYQTGGSDIDEIIAKVMEGKAESEFERVKKSVNNAPNRDLLEEQENIANLKKYNLALQNLQISPDMRKFFLNNNRKK